MGIYSLTNIPTDKSRLEIKSYVEGENIYIVCAERNSVWRDGNSTMITSIFVGDHMLSKPEDLRKMIGDDIATSVRLARDAGYRQAMAELRELIGVKNR